MCVVRLGTMGSPPCIQFLVGFNAFASIKGTTDEIWKVS